MQEIKSFVSQHVGLVFFLFIAIILVLYVELIRIRRKGFYVDPQTTIQKINHENAVVIDIRPIETYRKGHIIGALSMSAQELRTNPAKLEKFKDKPVILVCDTGEESCKLAAILQASSPVSQTKITGLSLN